MAKIQIDGADFDTDTMSEDARQQLTNLQMTDIEIQRLQVQLAIANTARNAYAKALRSVLGN